MTEFCKCGHHITQHDIIPEVQIKLFKMRGLIEHKTCIGYGKFLFEEKDYPRLGDVTRHYDPCPCKVFEPMKSVEVES